MLVHGRQHGAHDPAGAGVHTLAGRPPNFQGVGRPILREHGSSPWGDVGTRVCIHNISIHTFIHFAHVHVYIGCTFPPPKGGVPERLPTYDTIARPIPLMKHPVDHSAGAQRIVRAISCGGEPSLLRW